MVVVKIRKRDGSVVDFDKEKIVNAVFKAAKSIGGSDRTEAEKVAEKVIEYVSEKFKEDQIPTVEDIQDLAEKALIETGHATTAKSYIIYRHRKNVEREMKRILGVQDDLKLPLNSVQVLERRYLLKDDDGKVIETPSEMFKRVATYIASNEKQYGADEKTVDYYQQAFCQIMANFEFLPNSPTLMNAGTGIGQLAACFVLPVKDNIAHIFDAVKHAAIIHKTGGGCIRKGSRIFSTFCGSERIERLYDFHDLGDNIQEENGALYVDVGDENLKVPSFDKQSGKMLFKPIQKIWKYLLPSEKTFTISCEGNYLAETSEWHPFFVFEDGQVIEKRADELKQNDLLIISNPSLKENWVYTDYWDVENIRVDEEMAWLAGLFSTNGSLDETKQGLRLRFFSSDQEIIDKALKIIKEKTGKNYSVQTDTRSKLPVMRIAVYDQSLTALIKKLNRNVVGSKERVVRIPAEIFKSPLSVIGAYLAGVIDGDGHVSESKPQLEISGASLDFAEDLSSVFYLFGITSRYRKRVDKRNPEWLPMHEVSVSSQLELRQLGDLVLPYIALSRKKQRLEQHTIKEHSSSPANLSFEIMEPFLKEAGINTQNTEIWRKSIDIGKQTFFLARWKETNKINLTKIVCLIDELISLNISKESKDKLLMFRNVVPSLLPVKSVKRNETGEELEFYDFTISDTNNYLAGNMGLSVIHNTGFCFSYLRPKGDCVKSTAGVASGPLSFMSAFDNATNVIKQGGKRRGANMGVMHVWHPDIEEFITAKQSPGVLENFNVSVAVDDNFMNAVESNTDYNLINPRTGEPVRKTNARALFKLIAYSAWKSAEPGVLFIDTINSANPTPKFEIHATNPCVAKDTIVTTNEGLVDISKVHNPHHVLGQDGEYHPVTHAGKTGEKEVYLVKTNAGYEVKATADHKILTESGWKPVQDLSNEDKLVLQKQGRFGTMHVDKELANILGWLVGDGHMTKDVQDIILYFGKNEKQELVSMFKSYLDALNGREVEPIEDETEIRLKYSSKIAQKFQELGVSPLKSHEKEVPLSVFSMDQCGVKHFLSALFSADGSVQGSNEKGVNIRLSSSSIKLLKQVQILLLQFGVVSKVYEERRKEQTKTLPDSNREPKEYLCKAQHELIISRQSMFRFMESIGFILSSKNEKFESLKPNEIYSDNLDTSIHSVEKIGTEPVFDLTEPVTHSFSANGLIVHNCGEVPMPDFESCNLGSINISKFVELDWTKSDWKKKINWERLRYVVRLAVQFLDNVIDLNDYPLDQIKDQTMYNRRMGLGIMGFANMLVKIGVRYDSDHAFEIAEEVMKFVTDEGRKMSHELGRARGSFPGFKESIWAEKYDAMRNATITSIAPTGTISMIADTSSGVEPLFALAYIKTVMDGTKLYYSNEVFEHVLKVRGIYTSELMQKVIESGSIKSIDEIPQEIKDVFVVSHDIDGSAHVKMQAAIQKNTDLAVSKTINLPPEASVEDVENAYLLSWKLKCKGITIYRDGSRGEGVLSMVKKKKVEEQSQESVEKGEDVPSVYTRKPNDEETNEAKEMQAAVASS